MAMFANQPFLLVHEQPGLGQVGRCAVPFAEVIAATPRHLIAAQLYAQIAAPLKGGIFRARSLAMLFEVLAAVRVHHGRTIFFSSLAQARERRTSRLKQSRMSQQRGTSVRSGSGRSVTRGARA